MTLLPAKTIMLIEPLSGGTSSGFDCTAKVLYIEIRGASIRLRLPARSHSHSAVGAPSLHSRSLQSTSTPHHVSRPLLLPDSFHVAIFSFIRFPSPLQVVDMAVVVDVISQLETLPITKEALEVRQVRDIFVFQVSSISIPRPCCTSRACSVITNNKCKAVGMH